MAVKRKDNKGRVLKDGESQRTDGRYMYRYTDFFGNRKTIYAKDLNELRKKEKEMQTLIEKDIDISKGNVSFTQYAEEWLKTKYNIKEATKTSYNDGIKIVSQHQLGRLPINKIKPVHIKGFLVWMVENGAKYGTIRQRYTLIKTIFKDAASQMIIERNPCVIKLRDIMKPNDKQIKFLTQNEEEMFLQFLNQHEEGKKYYLPIFFLINTGLRFGEFSGLTWDDIDLTNGFITINHQLMRVAGKKKMGKIVDTKTKASHRTIYISPKLCNMLKEHKNNRPKIEPIVDGYSGFVFLSPTSQLCINSVFNSKLRYLRNEYIKTTNNQLCELTAHVFRHTYCTRLIEKGVSIKTVQYLMGHSDISTTLNIYTHIDQKIVQEEMLKVFVE